MLSYQHIYHSGSIADVHKHIILSKLLSYLTKDKTQICYYETHAGRGIYDLTSKESQKTGEAERGISEILRIGAIKDDEFFTLLKTIKKEYGNNFYPGSPLIAKKLLSPKDKIFLMELHPQEILHLKKNLKNVQIMQQDGYEGVMNLIPPYYKKGLILIDPSYEVKTEYMRVAKFIKTALAKWQDATIMIWYPILEAGNHFPMLSDINSQNYKNVYSTQLSYQNSKSFRMLGTGVVVINTPKEVRDALGLMERQFAEFIKGMA